MTILVLVSWLAGALVAGGLALVSLGIVRAGRRLDAATWSALHRALDRTIGPYLAGLLVVAIASTAAVAVVAPSGAPRPVFAAAAACLVVVLAISVSRNVPINRQVVAWSSPPADWAAIRARWNHWQTVRALAAMAAIVLTSIGLVG